MASLGTDIVGLVGTVVNAVSGAKSKQADKELQADAIEASYKLAAGGSFLDKIKILSVENKDNDKTFRWLLVLLGGVLLVLLLAVPKRKK